MFPSCFREANRLNHTSINDSRVLASGLRLYSWDEYFVAQHDKDDVVTMTRICGTMQWGLGGGGWRAGEIRVIVVVSAPTVVQYCRIAARDVVQFRMMG